MNVDCVELNIKCILKTYLVMYPAIAVSLSKIIILIALTNHPMDPHPRLNLENRIVSPCLLFAGVQRTRISLVSETEFPSPSTSNLGPRWHPPTPNVFATLTALVSLPISGPGDVKRNKQIKKIKKDRVWGRMITSTHLAPNLYCKIPYITGGGITSERSTQHDTPLK
eukprot:COSAG02_NODE_13737_length_1355_cov_83.082006_2_plen_168_part_00